MIETIPLTAAEKGKTWPKGRICRWMDVQGNGCTTPLSIHNGTRFCGQHGGWQTRIFRDMSRKSERERFMEDVRDILEAP